MEKRENERKEKQVTETDYSVRFLPPFSIKLQFFVLLNISLRIHIRKLTEPCL